MKTCNNRLPSFLADVQTEFDQVFNQMFRKPSQAAKAVRPSANIVENQQGFEITLDLPGVVLDDINVEVNEGRLTVTGKRSIDADVEGQTGHRRERWTGEFEREFAFPVDVDFDGVTAELKMGVLALNVPKSEKAKPRQIQIKVGE